MTPKMRLFQRAPVLLEKLYTHGDTATQMPMSPISHSCHILVTPWTKVCVFCDTLHVYGSRCIDIPYVKVSYYTHSRYLRQEF